MRAGGRARAAERRAYQACPRRDRPRSPAIARAHAPPRPGPEPADGACSGPGARPLPPMRPGSRQLQHPARTRGALSAGCDPWTWMPAQDGGEQAQWY